MVGKCIAELSQYQSKGAKLVPKIYFVHQATNIASGNASQKDKIKSQNKK